MIVEYFFRMLGLVWITYSTPLMNLKSYNVSHVKVKFVLSGKANIFSFVDNFFNLVSCEVFDLEEIGFGSRAIGELIVTAKKFGRKILFWQLDR